MTVSIRAYRPTDHHVCRALWAELTQTRRELYDEPDPGDDPGVGFEDYLTRLNLSGMWVAEDSEDGVVGLTGLILNGRSGEVFPVVVAARHRGKGVGTALLGHVADQARKRALRQLVVVPETRNTAAIKTLHGAGYDRLGAVRLTLDLAGNPAEGDEVDLHGLKFSS